MKNVLALIVLIAPLTSFAQQGSSNGGISVVCRNPDGSIKSARLLDLLEGEERDHYTYSKSLDQVSTNAQQRRGGFYYGSYFSEKQMSSKANFISGGLGLPNPQDFNPRITIKDKSCRFEIVALYDDVNQTLDVDKEIFDQLPKFDQLALYWHELLYFFARNHSDVKNSDLVRSYNAYLLSDQGHTNNTAMLQDLKAGVPEIICFLYYGDTSGKNRHRLHIDSIATNNLWFLMNKPEVSVSVADKQFEFSKLSDHRVLVREKNPTTGKYTKEFPMILASEVEAIWMKFDFDQPEAHTMMTCKYRD